MKKIFYLIPVAMLGACTGVQLPDDWKEINAEALENATFKESVASIDPEQTWNMAQDANIVSGASFIQDGEYTLEGASLIETKGKIESSYREKAILADYYRASSNFHVNLEDIHGRGTYTIGIYYKTKKDGIVTIHEEVLWKNVTETNIDDMTVFDRVWRAEFWDESATFGFYLKTFDPESGETRTLYSERSKNGDYSYPTNKFYNGASIGFGPYFIFIDDGISGLNYKAVTLSITWANVKPMEVKPLDYDGGPWMVLCEDVGSEADNDFNDVVFAVNRPDATHIQVELLAAGATRNNVLYFGDKRLGEVHDLFGVEDHANMINTYPSDYKEIGKTMDKVPSYKSELIEVDRDFTMASDNMGGFKITSNNQESVIFSSLELKGFAPFMICTPATDINWALEQVSIFEAYPKFAAWVADKTQETNWFDYPTAGKIYVRSK